MQLKSYLQGAAAAGLLAISGAALAAYPGITVPTQPAGPPPSVSDSAGAPLFVAIWNGTQSVVAYLGLGLADITPAALSASGTLDFGRVAGLGSSFDSLFSDSTTQYAVFAGDASPGFAKLAITTKTSQNRDLETNGSVVGAVATLVDWRDNVAFAGGTGANPVVSSGTDFAGKYFDISRFGADLGNTLSVQANDKIGNALDFYLLADNASEFDPQGAPTITKYAGKWLLSAAGVLTYTVAGTPTVPLPAAAWLLLSGLAGLGTVARRRKAA